MSGSPSSLASLRAFCAGSKGGSRERVAPWILLWIALGFAALALAFASGCGRTVLVSEASPIRMGPRTTGRIYALVDGEWRLSNNEVTIPEGWYAVPPSFVEDERR